jgi:hypothetical protein
VYEGGTATLSWTTSSGAGGSFFFYIRGTNPAAADLHTELHETGVQWFFPSLINQESTGRQFDGSNLPLFGPPDGIGLGQLEPTSYRQDQGYWNEVYNIGEAENLSASEATSALSFWNTQVAEAGSSHPAPSQSLPYCQFSGSPSGSQHGWQDAETITAYNGTGGTSVYPAGYYIVWSGTNATNGSWKYNTLNGRSYVGDVCNSAPL